MCVFQKTLGSPWGTILLRTKAIWAKRMRRLVSVRGDFILGEDTFHMGSHTNVESFSLWYERAQLSHFFGNFPSFQLKQRTLLWLRIF